MKVSLIIPTYNAGRYICPLLDILRKQTRPIDELIVVDSTSKDDTSQQLALYPEVKVIQIPQVEFSHGGTRNLAFQKALGDIVCCVTQDALPLDERYIENLLAPFSDPAVALSFGRQIAKADESPIEKYIRLYNYPLESTVSSLADIRTKGIKAVFATNVCAAYRKSAWETVGGFADDIPVSEDMEVATKLLLAGHKMAYVAEAGVLHSHHYNLRQQFQRNFDVGVYLNLHRQRFGGIRHYGEGVKMARNVMQTLLAHGNIRCAAYFPFDCLAKLAGNVAGKHYDLLPRSLAKKLSGQKAYWRTK
jgi:rhamnosyltransferase